MTAFLYLVMVRDFMYEHIAAPHRRARHLHLRRASAASPATCPTGGSKRLEEILVQYEEFVGRVHGLVDRNRIFIDRTARRRRDLDRPTRSTVASPARSCARPARRATCARTRLTSRTRELDFEMPVGIKGDNYDRYFVRMREMDESVHMIRQLVDILHPRAPINVDDRRCTLADEANSSTREIESLINHFKLVMDGPAGACRRDLLSPTRAPTASSASTWSATAAARRTRCTCARRSFVHMGGRAGCSTAISSPTSIPTFGSINMIGGECDR